MKYDYAIDMWSIGCVLFELYTGKFAFPGRTNNDMLRLFMEAKGAFHKKLLRKGELSSTHFDEEAVFLYATNDPVTKRECVQKINFNLLKPSKTISSAIIAARTEKDDKARVLELSDLLERMFTLDPSKRVTVSQALHHNFFK
jgi:serine/threonine-protein kinase PRP4